MRRTQRESCKRKICREFFEVAYSGSWDWQRGNYSLQRLQGKISKVIAKCFKTWEFV
jgi:hypothetical protein